MIKYGNYWVICIADFDLKEGEILSESATHWCGCGLTIIKIMGFLSWRWLFDNFLNSWNII